MSRASIRLVGLTFLAMSLFVASSTAMAAPTSGSELALVSLSASAQSPTTGSQCAVDATAEIKNVGGSDFGGIITTTFTLTEQKVDVPTTYSSTYTVPYVLVQGGTGSAKAEFTSVDPGTYTLTALLTDYWDDASNTPGDTRTGNNDKKARIVCP